MNIEKLKRIEIGHPVRYGQYVIDRYLAGNGLGWIIQSPEGRTFISRDPEQVIQYISSYLIEVEDLGEY